MTVISLLYTFIALAIRRSTLARTGSDDSHAGSRRGLTRDVNTTPHLGDDVISGQEMTSEVTRGRIISSRQTRVRQAVLKMLGE